ncbi:hypothetical protein JHK85_004845 [Glycine max]|nr:hypothetical protein JHK85_004845 [Glycine max]KAG5080615.1 hypothetical protein JHK86_004680 [Glycine max]
MKAAKGGYVRAMYNISLCFSFGEGLTRNHQLARKRMKRAADCGRSKAQFEHGLALFSTSVLLGNWVYVEIWGKLNMGADLQVWGDAIIF